MNPPGMFQNGERQQEYSTKYLLPISGRLIPEFDKRRSIKDMFTRKPQPKANPPSTLERSATLPQEKESPATSDGNSTPSVSVSEESKHTQGLTRKRSEKSESVSSVSIKRSKSVAAQAPTPFTPGQKSLKGFFKPKSTDNSITSQQSPKQDSSHDTPAQTTSPSKSSVPPSSQPETSADETSPPKPLSSSQDGDTVIDPIASKEDWSKLFTKKPAPPCDGHQEPCISLTTKKPGVNCGRSFWICQRPLGPSGEKEKGTQWRCPTFIWASDWNSSS